MQTSRRNLLAWGGAALMASAARSAWAQTSKPHYLSAGFKADNTTWLVGLGAAAEVVFALPLPGRSHAAAVHPVQAEAVVMARRSGRFAVVLNCATGQVITQLRAPEDRHFYGHAAYTTDGAWLLTTENDFAAPAGRLGVWDAKADYKRIEDISSGGIGPHDILRLPAGGFAVANGGIQTHPDYARAKLNLPDMRPNLTYLNAEGHIIEVVEPPAALHQNSIRHLTCDTTGRVFMALQWQGSPLRVVPLVAMHQSGQALTFIEHSATAKLKHYAGSIALSTEGILAVTGPKGNTVLYFQAQTGAEQGFDHFSTPSGVAANGTSLAITVDGGMILHKNSQSKHYSVKDFPRWDNHLITLV